MDEGDQVSIKTKVITPGDLKAGDVLLCVLEGREAEIVKKATGSRYTHAGICYNSTEVVDVTMEGIQKSQVKDFVSEAKYIAALRNPYVWSNRRISALKAFLAGLIEEEVGYDEHGAKEFRERKKQHKLMLLPKVHEYFKQPKEERTKEKISYICSELVASCFINTGIIASDAAVVFQPDTYSAGDLGREPAFGHLVGYLIPDLDSEIPTNDEFSNKLMVRDLLVE